MYIAKQDFSFCNHNQQLMSACEFSVKKYLELFKDSNLQLQNSVTVGKPNSPKHVIETY